MSPHKREESFNDIKNTINLELLLKQQGNISLSLYNELLLMINKQSNTYFFKFIKNELPKEVEQGSLTKFFLIYDLLKDKKSICMRERLSRESITELVDKDIQQA